MPFAEILSRVAAELALFAGAGFLLFGFNDLLVDCIYFARRARRAATVYTRHRPAYASYFVFNPDPGFIAILVPAWDESAVIASMLKATLDRLDYDDYRIFVGHYRNDPATAAAIASVADPRIQQVQVEADGPTTKADCLNHLYDALIAYELDTGRSAKAVVLHDAEDVVHRYELRIFDGLIDRAAVIQLPVLPIPDPQSRWVSGHYCDEFAEAHMKELVVREAVGAAIPLAGVGCAIARRPLAQLAALQEGKPFSGTSMTEDYEVGLRIGALGLRTMFVRIPAQPSERGVVSTRGHFPATVGAAVRQKARWLGGLAEALGAPIKARINPALETVLMINAFLLAWRVLMRVCFTTSAYGLAEGLRSIPRLIVGNVIAMLAAARAVSLHVAGGQDQPHLPYGLAPVRPSLRFLALAIMGWAGFRAATLGVVPSGIFSEIGEARPVPPIVATQFPAIEPVEPAAPYLAEAYPANSVATAPAETPAALRYVQGLLGVPVQMAQAMLPAYRLPSVLPAVAPDPPLRPMRLASAMPAPQLYSQLPPLEDLSFSGLAGISRPATRSTVVLPAQSAPIDPRRIDRLQLATWALLRSQQPGVVASPSSLASGGQLGASQAGARLTYQFTRTIAASLRTTTEVGRRGGEVAGGVRVQPLVSIPIWLTAERRQQLGQFGGGRNAFALFLEGGVYQRPMPFQFALDAYLQGGVVGLRSRDLFIDGAFTLTRPVYRNFSAGIGVWGGAQPGLYRLDVGPRITMQVRRNVRVHLDWRQRITGNAQPASGPAVTLATDF